MLTIFFNSIYKKYFLTGMICLFVFILSQGAGQVRPVEAATVIYVNPNANGANTGTTWKNAFTDLQSALAAASAGDEIWVRGAVYKPGNSASDTFQLVDGVKLYGGFTGTESTLAQRDWETNLTILSGDVGNNDTTNSDGIIEDALDISNVDDNAAVVDGSGTSATTVIDGFVITGGEGTNSKAGGLTITSGSLIVRNMVFAGNLGASVGGGLLIFDDSSPTISNVTFYGNAATYGGAIHMLDNQNGAFQIEDTTIYSNQALEGAAFYISNSEPDVVNTKLQGNDAISTGGAVYVEGTTVSPTFTNLLVSGNRAGSGAGFHVENGAATIINSSIVGNYAEQSISGIFARGATSVVDVYNSILWENIDNDPFVSNSDTAGGLNNAVINVYNSLIGDTGGSNSWNGYIGVIDMGDNIDTFARFMNMVVPTDANTPNLSGDYQLQHTSAAIDAGENSYYTSAVTVDVAGNNRTINANIDMGAYESDFRPLTLTVSGSGEGSVLTSTSVQCFDNCVTNLAPNTVVTVFTGANIGSTFTGWSGDCSGTGSCTVTMDSAKNVTAEFTINSYQLDVQITGDGAGSVTSNPAGIDCGSDCSETLDHGTLVTLTATPSNSQSRFAGWSGGGCSGTNPCTVSMTAATTVTAEFEQFYTINTSTNGNGSIDCSPQHLGACGGFWSGTEVTFTANAGSNWVFAGWGDDCSGNSTETCVLTIDAPNKTISAGFNPIYDLSVSKTGSGDGTVTSSPAGIDCGSDCSEGYESGTSVTLTANPDSDSVFAGWSGGGCSGTGNCTVNVAFAIAVTAEFTARYDLDIVRTGSGSGTVTSSPSGINCGTDCTMTALDGTAIDLTATAGSDSIFKGWSGGGCSGTAPCAVNLNGNTTVTAEFNALYELSVNVNGNGTVTSSPAGIDCGSDCAEIIESGETITLTATADSGHTFTGWTGGGCTGTDPCAVTVDAAKSVTAQFEPLYVLTISIAGSGSVDGGAIGNCASTCTLTVVSGTTVTLTAAAASGSIFDGWTGECSGSENCVISISEDASVTATFTEVPNALDVTVTKTGSGTGTVTSTPAGINCGATCSMSVIEGTVVTLTATADSDSTFVGWSGASCTDSATCTINVNSAAMVSAEFSLTEVPSGTPIIIYLPLVVR